MRVAQVVRGLAWSGGVQEYVSGLSRGLRDSGAEVMILAGGLGPPDGPPPNALADGLDIRWHRKRRYLGRYVYPDGLVRSIRTASQWADIIHVHQPFFVGTWIAAATPTPLVATLYLHPEDVTGQSAWRHRQLLRLLLRRLDLVSAVSDAERNLIRSVRQPRLDCVVWPGVEVVSPPQEQQAALSRPLVLAVGRLNSAKGIDRVVRAYAELGDVADTIIVGDGPQREEYERLCCALGMNHQAVLMGTVSDVELDALYRRASVFVSASTQESFGIAVLKAIANRCVPIVSDIASHREIIVGVGLTPDHLTPAAGTPQQLASKIRSALNGPPLDPVAVERVPGWQLAASTMLSEYESVLRRRLL